MSRGTSPNASAVRGADERAEPCERDPRGAGGSSPPGSRSTFFRQNGLSVGVPPSFPAERPSVRAAPQESGPGAGEREDRFDELDVGADVSRAHTVSGVQQERDD